MKNKSIALIFFATCSTTFAASPAAEASKEKEHPAANAGSVQLANKGAVDGVLPPVPKTDKNIGDVKNSPNSKPEAEKPRNVGQVQSLPSNLGFWITFVAVVAGSIVNWRLSNRTMKNQTAEAIKSRQADHQNKVSEYRHAWLQELRNTASELIKVINEGQSALMRLNLAKDYREAALKQGNEVLERENYEQVRLAYTDERVAASEIHKNVAKIKLMFKKNDAQAVSLFNLLDQVLKTIGDPNVRALNNKIIEDIVAELQIILKSEWETTKARMWQEP